ncbi:alpha/beta hydrolase [Myroides sp. JBRI-B21084]|uniref:alpha/beta fold hydrolase n=1 Tax=Myroides sp. JBRI-B21084 TaxID=3119977 RepID=UPI0026E29A99|nr:alpha/beta hydrolase [Paenimyroides cloacae]WKW45582.1 alpha/beta hydrolase [Paenimyroides cloacae]
MDVDSIIEESVFIQTTQLYYKKWLVKNAKNTIVLLHDSLGCTALWREWPLELALTLNCNVIAYDRRGYGKSDNYTVKRPIDYLEQEALILKDFLEYWQVKNPILFGFSDGASVATIFAGMFPDQLKILIIEGVHVLIEKETLKGIVQAEELLHNTQIAKVLKKYHGDKVYDLYYAWTKTWLSDAHQSWNIEHFIPKITVPVLVIQGEFDEFGTMNQVNAFDKAAGFVQKCIVYGVAHTAHKDQKDFVFSTITQFITNHLNEKMD